MFPARSPRSSWLDTRRNWSAMDKSLSGSDPAATMSSVTFVTFTKQLFEQLGAGRPREGEGVGAPEADGVRLGHDSMLSDGVGEVVAEAE